MLSVPEPCPSVAMITNHLAVGRYIDAGLDLLLGLGCSLREAGPTVCCPCRSIS